MVYARLSSINIIKVSEQIEVITRQRNILGDHRSDICTSTGVPHSLPSHDTHCQDGWMDGWTGMKEKMTTPDPTL